MNDKLMLSNEQRLLQHYRVLHDGLWEMIDGGRLNCRLHTDYDWIVRMLANISVIIDQNEDEG
jgi:hypothetical protein